MRDSEILDDDNFGRNTKEFILGENQVQINRYLLSFEDDETLVIKELPGKSNVPILGAVVFGLMGLFWVWVIIGSYQQEGFTTMSLVLVFFCLFSFMGCIAFLWTKYWSKNAWEFGENYLLKTNVLGIKKRYPKTHFKSIFVQKTIFQNATGTRNEDFNYSLALKFTKRKWDRKAMNMMSLENKDSIESFFGGMSPGVDSKAQGEAQRIMHLISFHWEIPKAI